MRKLIVKWCSVFVAVILAVGAAFALSGCDETEATLEDLAATDSDLIETITDKMETPDGTTVAVTFSGDSFDVTFTYDDVVDEELVEDLADAFDENEKQIKDSCESAIENLQTETGITGIVGTLTIANGNGDELWSRTYPKQ